MNDIKRVLRAAAWRIFAIDLLRALVIALCATLAGLIVLRIVEKISAIQVPWAPVAQWSAVGAAGVAVLWAFLTRADRPAVARRVDEGADLRETLSTALCVVGQNDPWSRITLESAGQRARDVNVRKAVPIGAPRFWPVPIAMALALTIIWVLPDRDLFGVRAVAAAEKKKQDNIVQVKATVEQELKKVEDAVSKLDTGKDKDAAKPEADKPEAKSPEEIKRDAIKKLTTMKEKIEQLRQGEKGQTLDAIKQELKQLKTPGDGPLTELSLQLAKGDMPKASQELQKLLDKVQSGQLSPEQKTKLAEQLKQMQQQLDKLAQDQKELQKALEKAGLDKKLAGDPEALKKALDENKNLSDEEKEKIQKQAQAQAKASSMCQSMAASMGQMSKSMGKEGKEGMDQEGQEAAENLAGKMSEMEQMASEMAQADAAQSQCEGSLAALEGFSECDNPGMGECEGMNPGTGAWKSGYSEKTGAGRGGPGRSAGGGDPGEQAAKFAAEKKKFNTKNQGGPIISSRLVEGEQIRGESAEQFASAAAAAEASATEAIENNLYPREYHGALKHYFGRLSAKGKAEDVGAAPVAPQKPEKKPAP